MMPIERIKEEIYSSHLSDFKIKLEEMLSICDSEIEKQMLLHLFYYFQNYRKTISSDTSYFSEIDFIEEEIVLDDPSDPTPVRERRRLQEKIERYNYRPGIPGYYKYIGFKFHCNGAEPISKENLKNNSPLIDVLIIREFEIYPQFEALIEGIIYKIDIAIILKRKKINGEIVDSRKIALECDGYDYHSSQQQIKNDDIRTRKLKVNGWKEVFRYSGTEIYHLDDIKKINSIFEEIIKMLMI